jgi:hypothetical protein
MEKLDGEVFSPMTQIQKMLQIDGRINSMIYQLRYVHNSLKQCARLDKICVTYQGLMEQVQ